ncbi:MAG: hypothetical protein FJX53_16255 [Alphaproteobacteria bacterium]|nr:hypothetical protein [Alphaproteobacteria bacterium]
MKDVLVQPLQFGDVPPGDESVTVGPALDVAGQHDPAGSRSGNDVAFEDAAGASGPQAMQPPERRLDQEVAEGAPGGAVAQHGIAGIGSQHATGDIELDEHDRGHGAQQGRHVMPGRRRIAVARRLQCCHPNKPSRRRFAIVTPPSSRR